MTRRLSVNGRVVHSSAPTLADLLRAEGHDLAAAAIACAVNATFVPRSRWAECVLSDGDQVDVISPVTGG